jgi:hypothetical protein
VAKIRTEAGAGEAAPADGKPDAIVNIAIATTRGPNLRDRDFILRPFEGLFFSSEDPLGETRSSEAAVFPLDVRAAYPVAPG